MRGGSIPLIAWGLLLVTLLALNWIWTGDAIQVGSFGFAALAILGGAGLLVWRAGREALRRGAPEARASVETIPQASAGAALAGLSLASILFGFTFGSFLIYFGAGLLAISIGRIVIELRAERSSRERWAAGRRR
jgi:hypothetical protein